MDYEKQIYDLFGQTLALQSILAFVLARIGQSDPALHAAIATGFDDAAGFAESFAIRAGKAASPEHTVKAIRIIEELRTTAVGHQGKPRHGV